MPTSTRNPEPTFVGFLADVADAATVIEGSMQGYLPRTSRRPSSSCYEDIATSGHIFVFEEMESGIRRWTDGVRWSPSRTRDGFMFYRELDEERIQGQSGRQALPSTKRAVESIETHESELYASLIGSYHFQENGLLKKTISVRLGDSCWRLVSYYRIADVTSGRLQRPSQDQRLWAIPPDESLRRAMQCWDAPTHPGVALRGHLNHPSWVYGAVLHPDQLPDLMGISQYWLEPGAGWSQM